MENKEIELNPADLDHRRMITKVRGGWTQDKIKKELKPKKVGSSKMGFQKEIAKYETPEEFAQAYLYHGSGRPIGQLKPSIVLKQSDHFGGGYEEQYYSISTSKSKEIASNFTGSSASGNVAPVLIKRGAVIKELPEVKDSNELDEMIVDLWTEGVDVVVLSQTHKSSEQEVAILNPTAAVVGTPEYFQVFEKKKMPSVTFEELEKMWIESSEKYKELAIKDWDNRNISFKEKHGRSMDEAGRWNSKQNTIYKYHQQNVEKYKQRKALENKEDVENFLQEKVEGQNPKQNKIKKMKR